MDLFEDEVASLAAFSERRAAGRRASPPPPMMRGKIEAINGVPVAELGRTPPPEFAFVFDEEIPLTSSASLPERSNHHRRRVVAGRL